MKSLKLKISPRLWIPDEVAENLPDKLHSPLLQDIAEQVRHDANRLVRSEPLAEGTIPAYGEAGRWVQAHLDCLTCAWMLTREAKYRRAAIKHLAGLLKWNHISCEARANSPAHKDFPYCLTNGEQSTAIALMYDTFRPDLTSEEQKVFFDVLDRFHMKMAVRAVESPPWWANKSWSNWNGVCAGGMGMMALAFYEDRPEAATLIPFVEKSLEAYFRSFVNNGGGCPEGTGYWNYGMNYAMRYVLSWEHATARHHPALKIKELAQSLMFPIDFTGISFGDNDGWHPAAFFFLLANRLGQKHAACRAAAYLPNGANVKTKSKRTKNSRPQTGDLLYAADAIPTDEQMKKLEAAHRRKKVPVACVYKGMQWGVLADDEAFPSLRMSIRGGSAKIEGHGMVDLLSFHCQVNGELMITDQKDTGYLVPTFGKRGSEIYPRSTAAKSTLFVEGLGCASDATCEKTEVVSGKGLSGVRIDATHVYLPKGRMPARFIGRLFLLVDNSYWLVIDHVLGKDKVSNLGVESRFHTYAENRMTRNHVALKSGKERLQMTFAAMQKGVMQTSRGMPPLPKGEQTTIFRWMGEHRVVDNLHVVAMNPGSQKLGIDIEKEKGGIYVIDVSKPGARKRRIRLSAQLRLR